MSDKFTAKDYRELHSRLLTARDEDVTAILSNNFNVVLGALDVAKEILDPSVDQIRAVAKAIAECRGDPEWAKFSVEAFYALQDVAATLGPNHQ